MKIPIFPGKYHQNGGFSIAMLVSWRVNILDAGLVQVGLMLAMGDGIQRESDQLNDGDGVFTRIPGESETNG